MSLGPIELLIILVILAIPALIIFVIVKAVSASSRTAAPAHASSPPRWAADPAGRHELRYWDGFHWTDNVSDGDVRSHDPL